MFLGLGHSAICYRHHKDGSIHLCSTCREGRNHLIVGGGGGKRREEEEGGGRRREEEGGGGGRRKEEGRGGRKEGEEGRKEEERERERKAEETVYLRLFIFCTCDHIFDVVSMSGAINVGVVSVIRLVLYMCC